MATLGLEVTEQITTEQITTEQIVHEGSDFGSSFRPRTSAMRSSIFDIWLTMAANDFST